MKQHNTSSDLQGFGVLPATVHRDPRITPLQKCILLDLSQYAGVDGDAWPRVGLLAEHQGVSRPTVYRALASLEKLGLVERHARRRSDGSRSSNLYRLKFSAWGNRREVFSPVRRGGVTGDSRWSAGESAPVTPALHHEEEQEKDHLQPVRGELNLTDEIRDSWQAAIRDSGMSAANADCWFKPLRLLGESDGVWWLCASDSHTAGYVAGPDMEEQRKQVEQLLGCTSLAITCE